MESTCVCILFFCDKFWGMTSFHLMANHFYMLWICSKLRGTDLRNHHNMLQGENHKSPNKHQHASVQFVDWYHVCWTAWPVLISQFHFCPDSRKSITISGEQKNIYKGQLSLHPWNITNNISSNWHADCTSIISPGQLPLVCTAVISLGPLACSLSCCYFFWHTIINLMLH